MNGFMTYSLAPASRAAAIWSSSVSVVTMTTISEASSGSWRSRLSSSSPLISGMFQSARTSLTAVFSASITFRPLVRWPPRGPRNPSSFKVLARIIRMALESSTTSALPILHLRFRLLRCAGSGQAIRRPCRLAASRPLRRQNVNFETTVCSRAAI